MRSGSRIGSPSWRLNWFDARWTSSSWRARRQPARPREATSTIPIVVAGMADPIADGLVASLARPGGNITGNTFLGPELIGKRFGLLKEAIPELSRVCALWHPGAYGEATMAGILTDTKDAARALEVQLQLVPARDPGDFDGAFAAITREHAEALISLPSPMLFVEHRRIVELRRRADCRQCTMQRSSSRPGA